MGESPVVCFLSVPEGTEAMDLVLRFSGTVFFKQGEGFLPDITISLPALATDTENLVGLHTPGEAWDLRGTETGDRAVGEP